MLFMILTAIAIGSVITAIIAFTMNMVKQRAKKKLQQGAKKVGIISMEKAIKNCDNKVSLEELEKLSSEGVTHMEVTLDRNGKQMSDIELIKDTSRDQELKSVLNRGDGIVVIEA